MKYSDLTSEEIEAIIRRTVYFVIEDQIIKGTVHSYDGYNLFVSNWKNIPKYGIGNGYPDFFFTEKELLDFLSETKNDISSKTILNLINEEKL